jgi:glycine cleavage system aminomethyltransferase T
MVIGNEPVLEGNRVVARVTSGGIGYAVDRSIAFASLPIELGTPGTALSVRVFDRIVPAAVIEAPLYDPAGERLRG